MTNLVPVNPGEIMIGEHGPFENSIRYSLTERSEGFLPLIQILLY